jgi:lipoyl(octanoyl) transferase
VLAVDLGRMAYGRALDLQRAVAAARIERRLDDDVLLLVEHPPVVTLGRGSRGAHLLSSPEFLARRGIEIFEVERGGDVTFHGPGQLVGYPIIDLKGHRQDLHWYLRQVEEALIRALARLGLAAGRRAGFTGVWTLPEGEDASGAPETSQRDSTGDNGPAGESRPARKIASIGVHARDWVTWHGFALNVSTDLTFFDLIVPCGISGVVMTSLARELGGDGVDLAVARREVVAAFADVFARRAISCTVEQIERLALAATASDNGAPRGAGY